MWGMTLKVVREEGGIRGLYRGMVPTAVGVAPYVVGHPRLALISALFLRGAHETVLLALITPLGD